MSDIKDSLAHLASLADGPTLHWPHMTDVLTEARNRIASLEAQVRFYERMAMWPINPETKQRPMEHEHNEKN